jgi:hypothetical protein
MRVKPAHARRKLFELAAASKAPIAAEAVRRIDRLFAVERDIAGLSAEARLAGRRERSAPILADPRALAAAAAGTALAQVGGRQGDRLHDQALGGADPVHDRRPDLSHQQRGRAGTARRGRRQAQLDLRRLGTASNTMLPVLMARLIGCGSSRGTTLLLARSFV